MQNLSIALNASKYLELATRYTGRKMFELQSFLEKVLVYKYCKAKVLKEQLIAKEQIKAFA